MRKLPEQHRTSKANKEHLQGGRPFCKSLFGGATKKYSTIFVPYNPLP